jgi:hypothetical protein
MAGMLYWVYREFNDIHNLPYFPEIEVFIAPGKWQYGGKWRNVKLDPNIPLRIYGNLDMDISGNAEESSVFRGLGYFNEILDKRANELGIGYWKAGKYDPDDDWGNNWYSKGRYPYKKVLAEGCSDSAKYLEKAASSVAEVAMFQRQMGSVAYKSREELTRLLREDADYKELHNQLNSCPCCRDNSFNLSDLMNRDRSVRLKVYEASFKEILPA